MPRHLLPILFLFASISPLWSQVSLVSSVQNEAIFPIQQEHTHGSSIVYLPNGDLLTVWFQGSGERKADDVRIMGSRKAQGQSSWSEPFEMADTPGIPDCNPVVFLNQSDELFLVWIAVLANEWEHSILRVKRSTDYMSAGAPRWTWQDNILLKPGDEFAKEVADRMKELPKTGLGWSTYAPPYESMILDAAQDSKKRSIGWMTRIKPLVLDTRIILPLYSDGFNFSLMAISEDQGDTWRPSLPLVGKGPIQPALVQKSNGDILAVLRDSGDYPTRIQESMSTNLGESWSTAQKTEFPNSASVEILRLQNGDWWMIGNDLTSARYQLALWRSDDEGETWSDPYYLEYQEEKTGRFSYPSLIQDPSGMIHITYSKHLPEGKTIQYRLVNPALLISK